MRFLATFFGSFYSAALYRRLRYEETGYRLGYSLGLLVWVFFLAVVMTMIRMDIQVGRETMLDRATGAVMLTMYSLPAAAIALLIAIALRAAMLFPLAVMARLFALKLKPPMGYDGALRMVAVAYTPAALMDAVSFGMHGTALNPFILFGCGVAMLLAALAATR